MTENKNNIKDNKKTVPTWRFIQKTEFGEYFHEIRKYPRFFVAVTNVSEDNNNEGCTFPNKFASYREALETLEHFRPGIRLVSSPEGSVCEGA